MKIFLLLLALTSQVFAQSGGGVAGGGSGLTVKSKDQRVLYDFLILDPQFTDKKEWTDNEGSSFKASQWKVESLFKSRKESEIIHFDEIAIKNMLEGRRPFTTGSDFKSQLYNSSAFRLVVKTLSQWLAIPIDFGAASVILGFSQNISWQLLGFPIGPPYTPSNPALPSTPEGLSEPRYGGYYQYENNHFRILLSQPEWDQLGIFSQAGLIIHEALRHAQLGLRNAFSFDDSILQKATSLILLCEPRPHLSWYLNFLMFNKEFLMQKKYGSYEQLVKNYCIRKDQP